MYIDQVLLSVGGTEVDTPAPVPAPTALPVPAPTARPVPAPTARKTLCMLIFAKSLGKPGAESREIRVCTIFFHCVQKCWRLDDAHSIEV